MSAPAGVLGADDVRAITADVELKRATWASELRHFCWLRRSRKIPEADAATAGWDLVNPVTAVCRVRKDENQTEALVEKDVYEGGHALWECSVDMFQYLQGDISELFCVVQIKEAIIRTGSLWIMFSFVDVPSFPVGHAVELGCGHGLPGLGWLLETTLFPQSTSTQSPSIVFQDLNKSVLLESTVPNAVLTLRQYYSLETTLDLVLPLGSHLELQGPRFSTNGYGLILSAEGIYRQDQFGVLASFIEKNLGMTSTGQAFFAAKRYYFGVGGGTQLFMDYIMGKEVKREEQPILQTAKHHCCCTTTQEVELKLFGDTAVTSFSHAAHNSTQSDATVATIKTEGLMLRQLRPPKPGTYDANLVMSFKDGRSNIRDIVKINWHQKFWRE